MSEPGAVVDLFTHEGFQGGLIAGLAFVGLLLLASTAGMVRSRGWAIGLTSAVCVVLGIQDSMDPLVLVGLAAIALAGLSLDLAYTIQPGPVGHAARWISWTLIAISIIWFTSVANTADEPWISVAFPLVVLIAGAAIWSYRHGVHSDLLGPMLAVTVVGVWVTVPETDLLTVLVGASLAVGLATLRPIGARAAGVGSFALAGLIAWLTIVGGATRPSSIVGSWASFGVLPLVPLIAALGGRPVRRLATMGVHVVHVFLVTRVVDIWDSIWVAIPAALGLIVASALVLKALSQRETGNEPV